MTDQPLLCGMEPLDCPVVCGKELTCGHSCIVRTIIETAANVCNQDLVSRAHEQFGFCVRLIAIMTNVPSVAFLSIDLVLEGIKSFKEFNAGRSKSQSAHCRVVCRSRECRATYCCFPFIRTFLFLLLYVSSDPQRSSVAHVVERPLRHVQPIDVLDFVTLLMNRVVLAVSLVANPGNGVIILAKYVRSEAIINPKKERSRPR